MMFAFVAVLAIALSAGPVVAVVAIVVAWMLREPAPVSASRVPR